MTRSKMPESWSVLEQIALVIPQLVEDRAGRHRLVRRRLCRFQAGKASGFPGCHN